ncbi:hypothetical protein JCM11641_008291 [Rhodosporidiobolus odoratus]
MAVEQLKEVQQQEQTTDKPAWNTTYDSFAAKLPSSVSSLLPSSSALNPAVTATADKFNQLTTSSKAGWTAASSTATSRVAELQKTSKEQWRSKGPEAWCACAWAVQNETSVPLNVSLNQVGPLYYTVLKPEETFERRVPNLPFSLEIRPFTSDSTAYTPWSTTWPILAVTGPAVAITSLLALPLVAVAAGGTALASLTSFGSSIAAGAAAAGDAAVGTAATATALVAKASSLPGARQVKGRLADAAKKAVGEHVSREKVQQHVVRYLTTRGGAGAAGGAIEGGAVIEEIEKAEEERRKKARKEGKVEEVDVTGIEMEKVLKCETGNAKVDKALAKAFKKLAFKSKLMEYKTSDNPVLRIVGGPELESRTSPSSFLHPNPASETLLVFYPFTILHSPSDLRAEPIPTSEVPPTEDEQRVMKDAKVVEKWETAERAVEDAPNASKAEDGKEGEEEVERAVEEAEKTTGEVQEDSPAEVGCGKGKGKEEEKPVPKKKGWFW